MTIKTVKTNILWATNNTDSVNGVQEFYTRLMDLCTDDEIPWILFNISCQGSNDTTCSDAVLNMLTDCPKPIKTQVISHAQSYGVLYSCVGEERVAWPKANFMHHSIHVVYQDATSIERMKKDLAETSKIEKQSQEFMKKQMGEEGFKKLMKDFKKNSCQDYEFTAEQAVAYGLVHKIGKLEPLIIKKQGI
jgi:ATP-dependent protease ClpP protease subunit